MDNVKGFKNIREFMSYLQKKQLEEIIQLIIKQGYMVAPQLLTTRTKRADICQARRLIAFLARWKYNIDGSIIADRLNLDKSQIYAIIYSTFHNIQVEGEYRQEIQTLMNKLPCI